MQKFSTYGAKAALVLGDYNAFKNAEIAKAVDPKPRGKFTQTELGMAYAFLMTGKSAQRPSWAAVRKTMRRARRGLPITGRWRVWPAIKEKEHA